MLAGLPRLGAGSRYRRARAPAQPLELYSFEASPFCRIVREALSSLELTYLLHNVARDSPRREAFVARSGRMMVPGSRTEHRRRAVRIGRDRRLSRRHLRDMSEPEPGLRVLDGEMDEVVVHPARGGRGRVVQLSPPGRNAPTRTAPRCCRSAPTVRARGRRRPGRRRQRRARRLARIEALDAALAEARREQWPLRTAVMNGFERANEAIRGLGVGACTTLAAVEVSEDRSGPTTSAIR